ncbi:alpha/beta hydrolase [Streptomyces apocyni]|uniref:alpha/beta hydrolase n=1 Tax=Streptomyces apocyni TaxID=2654677 RepID=UPI0012E9A060|nr:alpha/beta hydrolase [Streptomyces apocyni]
MSLADDRLAPDVRGLVDLISSVFPDVGNTVTDAAEARRVLAAAPEPPWRPPEVGSVEDRTIPGPEGAPAIPVRIYLPDRAEALNPADALDRTDAPRSRPTVVFFHGGGWVLCGLDSHDGTARRLCRDAGAAVVSVGYRLAPEHPFPAAVQDALAAVRWAASHTAELGGDPDALAVAGDSAGGNLAAVVAQLARDGGGPSIGLQILVYPSTDMTYAGLSRTRNASGYFLTSTQMEWFAQQYLGAQGDPAHPHVSPLRADLTGLPPAHIVTAGCDPLCDEGRAYAAKLRAAGVPVTEGHFPRMFHGFFEFPELLEDARTALVGVVTAVEDTLAPRDDRKNSRRGGGGAG